jgi:hypothetical protein
MELTYRKTARQYYGDLHLSNLLHAVFKKYQGQNGVRGNARIRVSSSAEAQRLQNYFGNRINRLIHPGAELEVPLKFFAEELQQGYRLTIPDLYEVLYNEALLTKNEQKQLKEFAWIQLFEKAKQELEQNVGFDLNYELFCAETFNWFARLKNGAASGYRVLASALNKGDDAAGALLKCAKALWHLFVGKEAMFEALKVNTCKVPIPMFASFVTRNPHAFDRKETAGRLLWYALYDIENQLIKAGEKTINEKLVVPEYMHRRQIYRNFGLWDDDISSFSHVFAPQFISGTSPRTLNLNEILAMKPFPVYSHLYVFENPSVFSHIVDEIVHFLEKNGLSLEQIAEKFPALVCTSGQSRHASTAFIAECLKANPECRGYYSGDLDLPGIHMLLNIQNTFSVNFAAHRMDDITYRQYADAVHLPLSFQDKKVIKKITGDLPKVMVELGVKVYQEEFAKDLKEDVIDVISRELGEENN